MLPRRPTAFDPDFVPDFPVDFSHREPESAGSRVAAEAPAQPGAQVDHHCQICPTCGYKLTGHHCKLVCTQCGYYLSCADYY